MKGNDLDTVLQKDAYQVFLFTCPATLPFSFATHPWFVVNRKGTVSRYGVSWRAVKNEESSRGTYRGHLHLDSRSPEEGIGIFPFVERYVWHGRILNSIEGDDGSLAQRMADFIEQSFTTYPYAERYSLFGPNSNTYVAWVLDRFPESGMRLPWNALGKNFI